MEIIINREKCNGCKLCIDLCPADELVFEIEENAAVVKYLENCIECQSCAVNCENGAVTYLDDE